MRSYCCDFAARHLTDSRRSRQKRDDRAKSGPPRSGAPVKSRTLDNKYASLGSQGKGGRFGKRKCQPRLHFCYAAGREKVPPQSFDQSFAQSFKSERFNPESFLNEGAANFAACAGFAVRRDKSSRHGWQE
jgi:hypothetical protein